MDDRPMSRLQRRVSLFRWLIPVLVLSLALIHLVFEFSTATEPTYWEFLEPLILLAGVLSAWWILTCLQHRIEENEVAELALREAYGALK